MFQGRRYISLADRDEIQVIILRNIMKKELRPCATYQLIINQLGKLVIKLR